LGSLASFPVASAAGLLVLRALASLGIGGVWPNAVAMVAEAWADASRPFLAGLLGAAANFGQVLMGVLGYGFEVTPASWRWVLLRARGAGRGAGVCLRVPAGAGGAGPAPPRPPPAGGAARGGGGGPVPATPFAHAARHRPGSDSGRRHRGQRQLAGALDRPRH